MLDTTAAVVAPGATSFQFVVPGDKVWTIRSVIATCTRASGGAPDRAYLLEVATSTGVVAAVGAVDAGDEPGTCTITWANCPASSVASANIGVSVAPFNPPTLQPGYTITGTITSPAAGDSWDGATAWYDFAYTGH